MSDRRPSSDEMCPNPVTCPFVDTTEPHPVSDHPGVSDRRPEMEPQLFIGIDGGDCYNHVEAEFSDLIVAIRAEVESGTIKGEVVDLIQNWFGEDLFVMNEAPRSPAAPNLPKGVYVLVGPVSDGGSET